MRQRIDYYKAAPKAVAAMRGLQAYVDGTGLDHRLVELVKTRASQINGCAYCVDMHTKALRQAGESEARLFALAVWHESPFFSARERAALAWCEAVTKVSESHVPDAAFAEAQAHFAEAELVDLTMAIIAINGWNRLAVAFRRMPAHPASAAAVP
ncbi:MAG: carboxymuconolactone decarboxylase family protein [Alphaproteobacteria bacterium]